MTHVLVIDNYDSFVYNLVQYLSQLGAECDVRRNDTLTVTDVGPAGVDGILLSPGPGEPAAAGICVELVRAAAAGGWPPVLGVCLGHQAIGVAYGARVVRSAQLRHGKTSAVRHAKAGVLAGLPSPFPAARYHSLVLDEPSLPAELEVTAQTADGTVMAVRHRDRPLEGVQFHPESVLTHGGHRLMANWLARCGSPDAVARSDELGRRAEELRLAAG